jgi:hypothetical protein
LAAGFVASLARPGGNVSIADLAKPAQVSSWHFCDIARSRVDFRFRWKSGRAADIAAVTEFDAVDGAHSAASRCHRVVASKRTT